MSVLQPTSISTSTQIYGDVTLLANAAAAVTLTATTSCATSGMLSPSLAVYANLNPAELDVDAGEAFGLQVQSQVGRTAVPAAVTLGSTFTLDIRVNSASSPLVAFQVRM